VHTVAAAGQDVLDPVGAPIIQPYRANSAAPPAFMRHRRSTELMRNDDATRADAA
jgi:hypothetical protein